MQLTRSSRAKLSIVVVLGGATAIVACSSASSITEVSGGFAGSSGAVGGTGSGSSTGTSALPPRCPEEAPTAGSGCTGSGGARCYYGPDVRNECAAQSFECTSGRWKDITRRCAVECPETFASIVPGATCGDIEMACNYEEGTCGCMGDGATPDAGTVSDAGADASDGGGEGGVTKVPVPGVWKCVPPPATVGCPSVRPHVLNGCVKAVTCDYGTCELGRPLSYDCTGGGSGEWQESFDPPTCDQ